MKGMLPRVLQRHRAVTLRHVAFRAEHVPEVAAGFFWDPSNATGSDSAGFSLPESNGKTTHNVITPAAGTAPAIGSLNGRNIITYTNQAVADDISRTASVQRGFTGSMGFGGWINQAAAAGTLITHGRGANQNAYIQFAAGSVRVGIHDGVGNNEAQFPVPPGGYAAGPFFVWATFNISLAAASRIGLSFDTVAQTPNVTASPGTTARDTADVIAFGGPLSDSSTSNIGGDWSHGMLFWTSGIPSAADLSRMMALGALK